MPAAKKTALVRALCDCVEDEQRRLTRRFPVAMTEDGYRRLKRFASEARLDEGEALSFLFEHFDSVTDKDTLTHRLRLFNSELEDRKQ